MPAIALPPLTSDQLSSITGWISIALWIVVFSPQIWENYQLKSGDGLSVTFIVLWFLGDVTNLFGSLLANLLPTMIILALYYSLCDLILLGQVFYYRRRKANLQSQNSSDSARATETSPLLQPVELPPSTQPKPLMAPYLEYPLLLIFVMGAGVLAWYVSERTKGEPVPKIPEKPDVTLEWKSQTLGWASAVLYLGSRLPQIALNYKTRCAGLSLAMFFFSISGNVTYVMSILFTSMEKRYLVANASWLAGSGLTVFLDLFVLAQFAVFSWQDRKARQDKVFVDEEGDRVIEDERA